MSRPPAVVSPVRVVEVEISATMDPDPRATPALALIRLHGVPIGALRLPATGDVGAMVDRELGTVIRDHLDRDGLPRTVATRLPMVPAADCAVPPATPPVTVVVCTRDRPDELRDCVASLLTLDYPAYEIVVVDNSTGDPAVRAVVEEARDTRVPVRYVVEPRPGLSRARNRGLGASRTEIVAFTDDDVLVDRGWLRGLVAGFADERVRCVTGLTMPAELETQAQLWFEEFGGFGRGFTVRRYEPPVRSGRTRLYPYTPGRFGAGVNMAFRRAAVVAAGGFDEYLGAGTPSRGGEDLDMFLSVLFGGGAVEYRPEALVWHRHRRDVRSLERQVRDYGVGLAAMVTKRLLTDPGQRRDIGRRVPHALLHALSPASEKNRYKGRSYPRGLTVSELLGMMWGPIAYGLSRRRRTTP